MRALTVAALRERYPEVPRGIKKKTDILAFILSKNANASPPPTPDPKKTKPQPGLAPVFAMARSASSLTCALCNATGSVWCEIGRVVCPVCVTEPIPSFEASESSVTTPEGRTFLKVPPSLDLPSLTYVVVTHGFGLCESILALRHCDNNVPRSVNFILQNTRHSAENYSLEQAQLNSEEDNDRRREAEKIGQRNLRTLVQDDVSEFTKLDPEFASTYIFPTTGADSDLLAWILAKSANRLLLFDYILLRRDAIKWYKQRARTYFEQAEMAWSDKRDTDVLSKWFAHEIETLRDALFTIPESSGAVPSLFRNVDRDGPTTPPDDEIEFLHEKLCGTHLTDVHQVSIEDDIQPV